MTVFCAIDLSQPRKFVKRLYNGDICINKEKIKTAIKVTSTTLTITLMHSQIAHASIGDRIVSAVQPLIEAVQALGYPLAYLTIASGAVVMIFNKRAGLKIIKTGAIGYLVLQLVPGLMSIIADVGKALMG